MDGGETLKFLNMSYDKKISLSINVSKIQKEHLFQGKKGLYMDVTIVPTPNSQYGDEYMVTQYLGKGIESVILGNGKDLNFGNDSDSNSAPLPSAMADDPDNLGF